MRRAREAPKANRSWTENECRTVLAEVPHQLRVPIALGMFTGLRKGDVLAPDQELQFGQGRIWRRPEQDRARTYRFLFILISWLNAWQEAPAHNAVTIAATTHGTPWTVSGFNSTFIKAIAKLRREGKVGEGQTSWDAPHCRNLLIETGIDIDTLWSGRPEDVGNGDTLFGDSQQLQANARRHQEVRSAWEQNANISV